MFTVLHLRCTFKLNSLRRGSERGREPAGSESRGGKSLAVRGPDPVSLKLQT